MPGLVGGSFLDKSAQFSQQAMQAYGSQIPNRTVTETAPGKTAGGMLGAAAGMGLAGQASGIPGGGLIGAGVGALSYLLS